VLTGALESASVNDSVRTDASGTTGIERPNRSAFVTTNWTVVVTATRSETTHAHAALARLCQTYWPSLYAYVRRRGYSPEDAEDLTQGFFAHLLAHNAVATVHPEKGRFRSFLLASLNHFLSDEWDKTRAQKRGGGKVIAFDTQAAETWLEQVPSKNLTPEKAFELRWAIALLEQVYQRLEAEHQQEGKAELFKLLRATLAGPGDAAPYAELAGRLGLSESAVKVAVHRLRRRYRELLRETLAETVTSEAEVEEELRYLLQIVTGA
jgi:RNA polymerase sigma factor (sigma-70 family)